MEPKRLYKDVEHKKLSGVCAGIADYFAIDATLVRLAWLVLSFFSAGFPGLILYILCAIIMEPKPANYQGNGTYNNTYNQFNGDYNNPTYNTPNQQPNHQQPQQPQYNPNDFQQPPQN